MAVRAVAFDIGGVLYRKAPGDQLISRWAQRLEMSEAEFESALACVDPGGVIATGGLTEAEIKHRYATALGLSNPQGDEFMADIWDWYCGRLDEDLARYGSNLRPRYRTGLLSNSGDGARREEQARYGFEELFDVIIYSHEVGLAKPDPRVYALLCDRLDVTPDELVFLMTPRAMSTPPARPAFMACCTVALTSPSRRSALSSVPEAAGLEGESLTVSLGTGR